MREQFLPTLHLLGPSGILLFFAVILAWSSKKSVRFFILAVWFLAAIWEQRIDVSGCFVYLLTACAVTLYLRYEHAKFWIHAPTFLALFAVGWALTAHRFPGFTNILIFDGKLTADAVRYRLYTNFDKAVLGLIFIHLSKDIKRNPRELVSCLKRAALPSLLVSVLVTGIAWAIGYVRWDPKLWSLLWIWIPSNLLLTCLTEEVLFRRILQRSLQRWFSFSRNASVWAWITASLLFGLSHAWGGWTYVALASVAGLFYGWSFQRSGSLEGAMLTHFTLNFTHLLLFTYPALA